MKNSTDTSWDQTSDLPICSTAPQPLCYRGSPFRHKLYCLNIDLLRLIYILYINPLNADLNLVCHLLVLLGTHHILHVSGIRVNNVTVENQQCILLNCCRTTILREIHVASERK